MAVATDTTFNGFRPEAVAQTQRLSSATVRRSG